MTGATGNWYCGLHEPEEMAFVLHALRPEDLFADIGANVGSYTVIAAGAVGARAVSVEPIPTTFHDLERNVKFNGLEDLVCMHRCGISDRVGTLKFTSDLGPKNAVVSEEFIGKSESVPVTTLDILLEKDTPMIMKIDVEGHETSVLRGARNVLKRAGIKAIIMETNERTAEMGNSRESLVKSMAEEGFYPYTYNPFTRKLSTASIGIANTIFIRDIDYIQNSCLSSRYYSLTNGRL